MPVEIHHLRAFVAVGQQLSFTRAAEQLFVTQPALSRTVKRLVTTLGVALLDRDTRHVRLTEEGSRFLAGAQLALDAVGRAVAAVDDDTELRLGFSWLLPDPWAQHAVAEYEHSTGNRVALVRMDDPVAGLLRGDADIAVLREQRGVPDQVQVIEFFHERRVLACSTSWEPTPAQGVTWADLSRWPLVFNSESGTIGPWSWPDGDGPARYVPTSNYDEWLESIAAGRGVGVVSELAPRRTVHPAVRFAPLADAPATTVAIAFVPDHLQGPKVRFASAATAVVTRADSGAGVAPASRDRVSGTLRPACRRPV